MTEKPAIGKGGRVPRIQTVTGNISFAFCSSAGKLHFAFGTETSQREDRRSTRNRGRAESIKIAGFGRSARRAPRSPLPQLLSIPAGPTLYGPACHIRISLVKPLRDDRGVTPEKQHVTSERDLHQGHLFARNAWITGKPETAPLPSKAVERDEVTLPGENLQSHELPSQAHPKTHRRVYTRGFTSVQNLDAGGGFQGLIPSPRFTGLFAIKIEVSVVAYND
jgi:hypothetical protein